MTTLSNAPVIVRPSDDRTLPTAFDGKLDPNYWCRGWNAKRTKYCGARAGWGTAHLGEGRCRKHGGERKSGDRRVRHGGRSELRADRIRTLIEQHAADPALLDVSRTLATAKALMDDFIERYYEFSPALVAWYASVRPPDDEQLRAMERSLDALDARVGEDAEPSEGQRDDLALARAGLAQLLAPRAEKPKQVLDISDAVNHADVISKIIHRVNQHHSQSAVSYARLATFMFELGRELDNLIADRVLLQTINERILKIRI